jgi:hypothetical protein
MVQLRRNNIRKSKFPLRMKRSFKFLRFTDGSGGRPGHWPPRVIANSIPEITLAAFSIFNVLRLGSYLPQTPYCQRQRWCQGHIMPSWVIWTGANASTAAYAVINISDPTLLFVSAVIRFAASSSSV